MSEQKTYINGLTIKEKKFANGNAILKIGVNVDKLIAQLNQHRNSKGYVNIAISARKTAGQYGDTHCAWLDTWEPTKRAEPERVQSVDRANAERDTAADMGGLPF